MSDVNATPVLRVSDDRRAEAFYVDGLRFDTVVNEAGAPVTGLGIFRVGAARTLLRRWDGKSEAWDKWRACFHAPDMDGMIAHLSVQKRPCKGHGVTMHAMHQIGVTDPDANVLCFGEDAS